MEKIRKGRRLKNRILLLLVGIILLQTVVCTSVIFLSGTAKRLDESTMQILSNTVVARGETLNEYFAGVCDISDYYDAVTKIVKGNAEKKGLTVAEYVEKPENRYAVLEEATPAILNALRKSGATASFLILENETGASKKDVVYLRDTNPQDNPEDNADIYVEAGYSNLLYEYEFTLGSQWTAQLDVEEACPFYQVSVDAGNQYTNIKAQDLGYFGMPCKIHQDDTEVITYSVPLLDENHRSYGVIGFGITLSYLSKFLPSNEITIDERGTYVIGMSEDMQQVETVTVGNSALYSALRSGANVSLQEVDEEYDIYRLHAQGLADEVSVSVKPLKLYNNNSPFEGQQWLLGGLATDTALHESSRLVNVMVISALISSLVISLIGTQIVAGRFLRPINTLLVGIDEMTPGSGNLPRTGIIEFDDIAGAMESQNIKIFKAGGKMADIIDNSNVPLAVFDYDTGADRLFCTHKIFDILSIPDDEWENNYISAETFQKYLTMLTPYFEKCQGEEELFVYRYPVTGPKWISIKRIPSAEGMLCILHDVTQGVKEKEKIMHDRDYDVLTDLYNRRAFAREMGYLVDEGHCQNGILSIWDLDNLKYANDTYGHDIGDKYIRTLADVFRGPFSVNSVCARLSGDEFVFFVYDAPYEELKSFLVDLHGKFMQRTISLPDGKALAVSASMGMARYTEDATVYAELLKCADYAMYQVKKSSKGQCKSFDREAYVKEHVLLQGVGELNRILNEGAIRYAFQPIVYMEDKRIFAYEALMRPVSDTLSRPDVLVQLAESQSRLGQIEHITWFRALAEFFAQIRMGDEAKLFLNSLPNQALTDKDMEALEQVYGDKLGRVVMEIIESNKTEADCEERKRRFCEKWGIPVALDDYGAGYSNNDVLMSRQFNFVKLDRMLIRNIHENAATRTLVGSVIEFCHANGQMVIAEGIEIDEEYQVLKEMKVDYGQGFYFAKPDFSLYRS